MKRWLFFLLIACNSGRPCAQDNPLLLETLSQLDSLSKSSSPASHFGILHAVFLRSIEDRLQPEDSTMQQLFRRFVKAFTQFYLDANTSYQNREEISVKSWKAYFSDSDLQPIQYKLLGVNAHVNSDLWQVFTTSFSKEELRNFKGQFLLYKAPLNKVYKQVYREAVRSNKNLRLYSILTLGMYKYVGNYYLFKWRKRQIRLAMLIPIITVAMASFPVIFTSTYPSEVFRLLL